MLKLKDKELGYLVLRVGLAINLMGHGLPRMGAGFVGFHTWITTLFAPTFLPSVMVSAMAYVIPAAELILGFMLLIGFKLRLTLVLASLLMFSLIFGMCILQKWEIVGLQTIYLFIYSQLISNLKYKRLCFDSAELKEQK